MSLFHWRQSKLEEYKINSFYYFSHKKNINTILKHGILPQNKVQDMGLEYTSFAEKGVQDRRDIKSIMLSNNQWYNIHDLVPLYLTPKTPTLYARKNIQDDLFFCRISSFEICREAINFAFSDGNAGSQKTKFHFSLKELDKIPWSVIRADSWVDIDDGKRKRNSEFLVFPKVRVKGIWKLIVNNKQLKTEIKSAVEQHDLKIEVNIDQRCFFN
jgi:hypothetical protein